MPLPLKTLSEVSAELGIPEAEIKAMVQMGKIRGLLKKGKLSFAPDEIAKIKRQRKSLPESAVSATAAKIKPPTTPQPSIKPMPPKKAPPRRFGSSE